MKKILHLNSYFVDNNLYTKIYQKLDSEFSQVVYVPIKSNREEENRIDLPNLSLFYEKIIKKSHSIFYFNKINILFNRLLDLELYKDIDLVHAHNLFIDGALAYKLKQRFGLKYIVAIRMTDISLQYKYMYHRRPFARKILQNAEKIIFISDQYQDNLLGLLSNDFGKSLKQKSIVIPNGIDDYWFENHSGKSTIRPDEPIKLIFIGQIIKRKNIDLIIEAIEMKKGNFELTVVGGENKDEVEYFNKFMEKISEKKWVKYLGKLGKEQILDEMKRHHIFIMPSKNELFGLVYIEAISQNLPVIFSNNEGISPYLQELPFAIGVSIDEVKDVRDGIDKLISNYNQLDNFSSFAGQFKWADIIASYKNIYKNIYE